MDYECNTKDLMDKNGVLDSDSAENGPNETVISFMVVVKNKKDCLMWQYAAQG